MVMSLASILTNTAERYVHHAFSQVGPQHFRKLHFLQRSLVTMRHMRERAVTAMTKNTTLKSTACRWTRYACSRVRSCWICSRPCVRRQILTESIRMGVKGGQQWAWYVRRPSDVSNDCWIERVGCGRGVFFLSVGMLITCLRRGG